MRNKGTLIRIFFALSLILALGVAPGLGAYAQQAEQATKAAYEKGQQPSAEGEPLPLSDAEMEKVEGGFRIPGIKLPSINFNFNLNIKSHNGNNNRCR